MQHHFSWIDVKRNLMSLRYEFGLQNLHAYYMICHIFFLFWVISRPYITSKLRGYYLVKALVQLAPQNWKDLYFLRCTSILFIKFLNNVVLKKEAQNKELKKMLFPRFTYLKRKLFGSLLPTIKIISHQFRDDKD